MPLASKLGKYVETNAIQCQLVHHARSQDLSHAVILAGAISELTIRAHLMLDRDGPALLVVPFQAKPDVFAVNCYTNRNFQLIDDERASKLFEDCDHGHVPVLGDAYGLTVYVDHKILKYEQAFASSGCANTLLKLPGFSIRAAFNSSAFGSFSSPLYKTNTVVPLRTEYSLDDIAEKLNKVYRLPPMPDTAVHIMHLTADPDAGVNDLADLVEHDPSLSAQIMRYARSALFNYRGELTCVRDAINIVLGFDRVAKLAMGIASTRAFRVPSDGPLGLSSFWQHALQCAVLSQALALITKPELEVDERESYLSGLLHNFGLLLVGELFPPEFRMMNKLREADPERAMREIEEQVFGMGSAQEFLSLGHGSLGAVLLKLWGLPEACVKAAAMHHSVGYDGDHSVQVELVQLSNYLLASYGIGDETPTFDPTPLFNRLGIDADRAHELADLTVEQCKELNGMVNDMVA